MFLSRDRRFYKVHYILKDYNYILKDYNYILKDYNYILKDYNYILKDYIFKDYNGYGSLQTSSSMGVFFTFPTGELLRTKYAMAL
jgi:hypothetical protein